MLFKASYKEAAVLELLRRRQRYPGPRTDTTCTTYYDGLPRFDEVIPISV